MTKPQGSTHSTRRFFTYVGAMVIAIGGIFALAYFALPTLLSVDYAGSNGAATPVDSTLPSAPPSLDKVAYDKKLLEISHVATTSPWYWAFLAGTSTITMPGATTSVTVASKLWPVRAAYPRDGRALLPFNRIVAYYGNFYSRGMGVLGQYDPEEMLARLKKEVSEWQAADPKTPVIPAIHYIVEVAQAAAGKDGMYRNRMPDDQIDKALALAKEVNGIVFLDFQVGLSTLQKELPIYEDYLKLPTVHLGVDPEFAMHNGTKPGRVIGTLDAADINYAAQYLASLVQQHDLPPKILVVHRFTFDMVTNYKQIKPLPEVQIVIDMDGWGGQDKKIGTYQAVVYQEPVQFAGFKLFYKNDTLASTTLLSPAQVIQLTPAPMYIQYQ